MATVTDLRRREEGLVHAVRRGLSLRVDKCKALYRKDLFCHYQCVNAIEFSNDGEFLVSGGDDKRVMLWKFGETLFGRGKPEQMQTLHDSNIFCLGITRDNSTIFSGGHDERVLIHDTATKTNTKTLLHDKAVCCLSLDPHNPKIVATAGNDGRLLIYDTRYPKDFSLVISRKKKAFNSCAFHPYQPLLVAANAKDGAALWDLRKIKHGAVISYGGTGGVFHNCMSVCFNKRGTQILALRRRQPPVLYALNSTDPLAHFYYPDYFNSCTMKSCCFAGADDEYVMSGSDDFNIYMWKIPKTQGAWVDDPHLILYGHRSIVNQVRFNPHLNVIASSGVEKIIKLWSPIYIPGCTGSLSEEQKFPDNPRELYTQEDYVSLVHNSGSLIFNDLADQSTAEDPRIMALFDNLVQRDIERWSPEDTDSQSDECPIIPPRNTVRNIHAIRLTRDSDASSGSDQIVQNTLKRAYGALRNQRYPKRTRLNLTRYPKVSRIHQKGLISRRIQKLQRNPTRASASLHPPNLPRTRSLKNRRGVQRGTFTQPPSIVNMISSVTESDADSDRPSSPMPLNRIASKMARINRRRMSLPRSCKKRSKVNGKYNNNSNGYAISREESSYSEDNIAVPSTSSGIRGHQSASLFRIIETNSDDDMSLENDCIPNTKKRNLDEDDLTTDDTLSQSSIKRETIEMANKTLNGNSDPNAPGASTSWDDGNRDRRYSSVLMRLRNETNESEVESSYSTGSAAEPSSPRKLFTSNQLPCTSNGVTSSVKKADCDSVLKKQKCKMKRLKRNYRRPTGDSDTT